MESWKLANSGQEIRSPALRGLEYVRLLRRPRCSCPRLAARSVAA